MMPPVGTRFHLVPLIPVGSTCHTSGRTAKDRANEVEPRPNRGNKIYENGELSKILTGNGYYEDGKYYFYVTNHLGSNVAVVDEFGSIIQTTDYYPFGMTAGGEKQDRQPYKYGNKELDEMNGLNLYDFLARGYDPAIGRFMSIDPLAEKYYSISPYAYCANNPVNNIDPTGMDYLYANDDTYIGQDDKESDYIRIVNNHMEQIINLTSSKSSGKVTAEMLGKLESVGIGDADLNGKSYSKIFTDILSKMSDVDATAELFNKKMSVAVFGDDGKLEERYNSAVTEYNQNASHYGENGKSLVTATIKTGAENNNLFLYSTVSNVQNMLGVHELIGHGLNGLGSRTRTHHQVYELQMNHSTWTNTTPAFKAIMATLYQRYLISEPK